MNIPYYQNDEDYTRFQIFRQLLRVVRTVDFHQMMRDFYRKVLFESTDQIRAVMTILAEQDGAPTLIHCASGKDRTGIIVAILQLLAGVPRNEVLSHYLLSNPLNESETERAIRLLPHIQSTTATVAGGSKRIFGGGAGRAVREIRFDRSVSHASLRGEGADDSAIAGEFGSE
jgi:hypothetical protein